MSASRLLTYREAADRLGVSTKTIGRRVERGALPVMVALRI
jgi:excisionase family DNA binding protein